MPITFQQLCSAEQPAEWMLQPFSGFSLDSRKVAAGQIFIALTSLSQPEKTAQFAQAASQLPAGTEDKTIRRIEGIINSMTPAERAKPELIKASRKRRIAAGCGMKVEDVNRLCNQLKQMQKLMKQFGGKKGKKMMARMGGMGGFGGPDMGGMGGFPM